MIIPTNYTPVQITVPDNGDCLTILHIWQDIYLTNRDIYSYVSYISLARTYNLIYTFIKTDNLKEINYYYPYTVIPISSAENINFYKLNEYNELILKEENDIQVVIDYSGSQKWYKYGKLHRDNDLPAVTCENGTQFWLKNGERHRDNDLPAVIYHNGTQEWYKDGERHRDNDLPAIIYSNGRKEWYKHGVQYAYPS